MFCKNCGKESDNTKKFCINCGTEFLNNTNTQAPPPVHPPIPKEPWTRKKIINTIVTVVLVGGFIIYKIVVSIDSSAVDTNNSALSNYNSGNSDQAISGFKEASENAVTNTNKVNSLKNLAFVYSSESKNDLALSTFQEALDLTSEKSFDYYLISGEIASIQGKSNSALLSFNKAYEMEPDNMQINNSLNSFYLDLEDTHPDLVNYPKALTYALKAYEIEKSRVTEQNLGLAYYFNNQLDNAISYFLKSDLSKEPYMALWLGFAYVQKEQPEKAKYYFNIAINAGVEIPQEVTNYMNSN